MPDLLEPNALPYNLHAVGFRKIETHRDAVVPEVVTVQLNVGIKVATQGPKLEVALQVTTAPEIQPVFLNLELMADFVAVDENTPIGEPDLLNFINDKALPLLWPYADLLTRQLSAAMGMPPIRFSLPLRFNLPLDVLHPSASASPSPAPSE